RAERQPQGPVTRPVIPAAAAGTRRPLALAPELVLTKSPRRPSLWPAGRGRVRPSPRPTTWSATAGRSDGAALTDEDAVRHAVAEADRRRCGRAGGPRGGTGGRLRVQVAAE